MRFQVNGFWSSDELTGNQTEDYELPKYTVFWSSDELTGNQTFAIKPRHDVRFWSSDELTGNQTGPVTDTARYRFWGSDELTGNQVHNGRGEASISGFVARNSRKRRILLRGVWLAAV